MEWLKYIQGKSNDFPEIDNSVLLCKEHNLLMYDLKLDLDEETFSLLPEDEWLHLKRLYKGGPELNVSLVIGDDLFLYNIDLCDECRKKRYHFNSMKVLEWPIMMMQ